MKQKTDHPDYEKLWNYLKRFMEVVVYSDHHIDDEIQIKDNFMKDLIEYMNYLERNC